MSYVDGTVEILQNTKFVPYLAKAQFKFKLELVFPIVQVFDASKMRSEFFKMKNIVQAVQFSDSGIRAIRIDTEHGVLQLTMLNVFSEFTHSFLPAKQAAKVIDEIIARAAQQYNDQQKPFVINLHQKNLPKEMDYVNQFDAEFAV